MLLPPLPQTRIRYLPRVEPPPRISRGLEPVVPLRISASKPIPIAGSNVHASTGSSSLSQPQRQQRSSPSDIQSLMNLSYYSHVDPASLFMRLSNSSRRQKSNRSTLSTADSLFPHPVTHEDFALEVNTARNSIKGLGKPEFSETQSSDSWLKRSKSEDLRATEQQSQQTRHQRNHSSVQRIVETSIIYSKDEEQDMLLSPWGIQEHAQGRVNQYHLLKDIGTGAYGRVVLVRSQQTGRYYACKVMSKNRLRRKFRWMHTAQTGSVPGGLSLLGAESDHDMMDTIKREVAVLKKLSKHPNIVNLIEVLDDVKEDNLYMIFELCEYGPVMQVNIGQPERPFTEELARKYFRDVVLGLEYLHFKRIIHRDIKPENLLRTVENVVQIGDFGISHMFEEDDVEDLLPSAAKNGSPAFSPPEVCSGSSVNGKSLDIWSLGVTLYCFVHGRCPWEETNPIELSRMIINDQYPVADVLSGSLKDLLKRMLAKNPSDRIRMPEIKEHDWVTESGNSPMMSTEKNCVFEDVTDEEVAKAFRPAIMFVNKS
eukprot:jgi/Hompol1/2292/HPOL_005927-RA